ncbi:unnamed protein product [Chironomus riparius]|uniref:Lipase domain-containing protein n=1 Tax=Chironomus riparius TaxID=315576 RepID=A0A9N9WRX1_9DIPT|nr:unnamed protein product [Chironomus riparius]
MIKLFLSFVLLATLVNLASSQASSQDPYAIFNVPGRIFFQVYPANGSPFNFTSTTMTNILQACPDNVPLSFIIHGWSEGVFKTKWIPYVLNATLNYSGGCVVAMDYSYFSAMGYGDLVYRYFLLRDSLVNVINLFGNYSRMHFFGFSFGARLAIGAGNVIAGYNNGVPQIPRMDLCDPAGPNFMTYEFAFAPAQKAATLVQVINTNSFNYGTGIYDAHINFKMGHCGIWQDGQGAPPMGSHGMCPYMYYYSFFNDYKHNPVYKAECNYGYSANRPINATCQQTMIMGRRNTVLCYGDVLIPTSICPPYLYNNTIYNYPAGKATCT